MPESIRLSSHGSLTEERLLQSAVKLFSAKWYGMVSVAEICRDAGLSNGVFYRYFKNKEELCKTILGATLARIEDALQGVGQGSVSEKLARFTRILIDFSAVHPDLIAVFREGQYSFIEYEQSLEALYRRGLSDVFGSDIGEVETSFALGGIRFCAIRRGLQHLPIDPESVLAIVRGGFFPGLDADESKVFSPPEQFLPVLCEEKAKDRLLLAGKRLFGDKSFAETNIHQITDAAGLAVGTFYTYFPSKEAFYAELVRLIGHDVRFFISSNLTGNLNRLEREMRGLWLFLRYLQIDKYCYPIVRQAEFIMPDTALSYYDGFLQGYGKRPLSGDGLAPGIDERTAAEYLLGIGHYLGIQFMIANDAGNADDAREDIRIVGNCMKKGFSDLLR